MQLKVPDLSRLADEKIGVISELAVQQRIIFSSWSPRFFPLHVEKPVIKEVILHHAFCQLHVSSGSGMLITQKSFMFPVFRHEMYARTVWAA